MKYLNIFYTKNGMKKIFQNSARHFKKEHYEKVPLKFQVNFTTITIRIMHGVKICQKFSWTFLAVYLTFI